LIQTLKGYEEYYRESGETWERQAALKARFVAGNRRVGDRFVALLHAVSYGQGLTAEQSQAIVEMKQRIETERLKPEEQHTDLKLGYGGLTDIEWLAQRLQFQFGKELKELRVPGTLEALTALARVGVLDGSESDVLTSAYLFLSRLRNTLWLHSGTGQDVLPSDPVRLQTLARQMGYLGASAGERLREEVEGYMQEVRRIFQHRFLTP
jgi:glutamate-ammonia-ligase adenylyltransferase